MKTLHTILVFFAGLSSLAANTAPDAVLKCASVNFKTEEVTAFDNPSYVGTLEKITFINDSEEAIIFETMTLEFVKGDHVLHTESMNAEDIYKAANTSFEYAKSGLFENLVPCGSAPAYSRTMGAGECLIIQTKTYVLNEKPEKVRIVAKALSGDATIVELSYEISLFQTITPVKLPAFAG